METLGQKLKTAREAKGVSESEAGSATKILTKLIVGMEADDFSEMAAPTYAKGFIRLYSDYLGIDSEPLIEEYLTKHAPGKRPLLEENQLEQNSRGPSSGPSGLDKLPAAADPRNWLSLIGNIFSAGIKKLPDGPLKDVRVLAGIIAVVVVLIILITSATTCRRKKPAPRPTPPAAEPAKILTDDPLPDLYWTEPGKIESSQ